METSSPEIITANRVKRSEGPLFQFCYQAHKILTYLMIGKIVKFGKIISASVGTVTRMCSILLGYQYYKDLCLIFSLNKELNSFIF